MSRHRWGFFPFDAMDYKAAQAYLDQKARQGWVLDKLICSRFARFVPAGGRYHAVDLDLHGTMDDGPDPEYLQLCRDAGWELVKRARGMLLFRSLPGTHPAPLQTDGMMEAERFWKKCMRRNFLAWLFCGLIVCTLFALVWWMPGRPAAFSELLRSNALLLLPPILLCFAAYLLWSVCFGAAGYLRFRRSGRFPERGRPGAWGMGTLSCAAGVLLVLASCLCTAESFGLGRTVDVAWSSFSREYTAAPALCQSYPVVTAADLDLSYSEDSRYLDGRRALLVDFLDYSEISPGEDGATHILTTERYDCLHPFLARLLFSIRRGETAQGAGFTWGELDWGEVSQRWGFDQVCTTRDGSYLLLRAGDTVALVGASGLDLTQPEHLETIRQRVFP